MTDDSGVEPQGHRRVAWVTGASRGVGRGIAVALGEQHWTVYVSARSTRNSGTSKHLGGTIEECAETVTACGGEGHAVLCDHRDDQSVAGVVARITAEQGRLDLLVNNVWAGYERLNAGAWEEWNAPLWDQPLSLFDDMFDGGVRAHYVTLALSAPLLIATPGSAVVTISFDTTNPGEEFGAAYSAAKTADDRIAQVAARQLKPHGVTSIALHPSLVRTEGVMQFADCLDLSQSQSPEGVGRAVAALADDPDRTVISGQTVTVDHLARRYNIDVAN